MCDGMGEVPDKMLEWMKIGKAMRHKRIDNKLTLRDTALLLRVNVQVLSEMELGKRQPNLLLYDNLEG